MQSRAADGAKEVMRLLLKEIYHSEGSLFRTGIKPWAFIHDQFCFKIPKTRGLDFATEQSKRVSEILCEGMQRVTKNVRVTVETVITERWSKDDSQGLFIKKFWRDPART